MMFCRLFSVLTLLCLFAFTHSSTQRLIILMLDGVRYDYVTREPELKGFPRMAREGVKVKYVSPIYPSNSYPNWYTIATGLYAESHGFLDNKMWDRQREDKFLMAPHPNASHPHWWNKTEPIWINAEKNGKRTAMHYWDGCQVPIHGFKPMLCERYRSFWNWTGVKQETIGKMAEVVGWFEELETHQLALIYYEGPDAYGHKYGPDSEETKQEMRETDHMVDLLQDFIETSKIKDQINLIVLSDHGMTDVEYAKKIVLDDFDGKQDFQMLSGGAEGGVYPPKGKSEEVYSNLKKKQADGLHVYRKAEIPEIYHIKNNELTPPIQLVANHGYRIMTPNTLPDYKGSKGSHGYDPYVTRKDDTNEMRTIMFAKGPAFQRGLEGRPISQTDHYNIFCHVLGLPPHSNNGSWIRVKGLFADSESPTSTHPLILFSLVIVISFSVLCIMVCIARLTRSKSSLYHHFPLSTVIFVL